MGSDGLRDAQLCWSSAFGLLEGKAKNPKKTQAVYAFTNTNRLSPTRFLSPLQKDCALWKHDAESICHILFHLLVLNLC